MKQVIIIRKDLNMSPGKAAAQCCHASLTAYKRSHSSDPYETYQWYAGSQTKVILTVDNEEELLAIHTAISIDPFLCERIHLIVDEGRTEIPKDSVTALGVGPAPSELINKYTSKLKLYR